jgi:hypothetical protein
VLTLKDGGSYFEFETINRKKMAELAGVSRIGLEWCD